MLMCSLFFVQMDRCIGINVRNEENLHAKRNYVINANVRIEQRTTHTHILWKEE